MNETLVSYNNTVDAISDLSSMTPIFGVLVGLVIVVMFILLSNESWYNKIRNFLIKLKVIKESFNYFLYGLGTLGFSGLVYLSVNAVSSEISQGFPITKYFFIGIIGYVFICFAGIPLKFLVNKIKHFEHKRKRKKL